MFNGFKRNFARAVFSAACSAHFMRRRALSMLNRHFTKGELTLRYKMKDHTLFLDPNDDVIAIRVLLRGNWQRRDLERVVALLKKHRPQPGKLFIDVGANIGTETVYAMLSGYFSGGIAIEPEPRNFSLLSENIAVNSLAAKVRAVQCAVGAVAGTGQLVRTKWNNGGHAIDESGAAQGLKVDVLPLSAIVHNPAEAGLIWMDVNGTEASVLKGMGGLLEASVPLVIEHLPSLITEAAAREIHAALSRHYRYFCRIDDVDEEPRPVDKMDPLRDTGDFLFF